MTHPLRQTETQDTHVNGNVPRASALDRAGIDEAFIANKLKEQLEAKQRRWNPKKKDYELFADNDARLVAIREVIKILGGYPSEHGAGPIVIWQGDLGELRDERRRRRQQERPDLRRPEVARVVPQKAAAAPEEVTCASVLRQVGVNESFIAKKLKELLEAKQPRWNPKKQKFELDADNDARLAAIREVVKIVGGYPSEESEHGERTVIVRRGSPAWEKAHKHGSADSPVPDRT